MRAEAFRPPLTLTGRYVELVPLERSHVPALLHAARDPEVSRYLVRPVGPALADVERLVDWVLEHQAAGGALAFTTVLRETHTVVGMSRFLDINPDDDSVQIGGTFLEPAFWRSPLNTDAKLEMLRYAFETGEVHRVWLQTDVRNERSQAAIARLGAVREGVLREDRRFPNGTYRSSVVFSILAGEWPKVRERLSAARERPWTGRSTA